MSVSETFDRKFNKCMRGYIPEEVDDALDAILRYCDDLEGANLEFEEANNNLIDEKNALLSDIERLKKENSIHEKKIGELSANLSKIESVYNEYRTKFGEARNLVATAKASAEEITARAEEKAAETEKEAIEKRAIILADAEEKRKATFAFLENKRVSSLAELDRLIKVKREKADSEIKQKEELIAELDRTYSGLCAFLTAKLTEMLGTVSEIREKTFDAAPDNESMNDSFSKAESEFSSNDDESKENKPFFEAEKIEKTSELHEIPEIPEIPDMPAEKESISSKKDNNPENVNPDDSFENDDFFVSDKDQKISDAPTVAQTFIPADSSKNLDITNDLLASLKELITDPNTPAGSKKNTTNSSDPHMTELKNVLDRIGERVNSKKSTPNT